MSILDITELSECPDQACIYRLTPKESLVPYHERVDRNIGMFTWGDQNSLRSKVVGIAGCGGMGGYVAQALLRLGIGELRLADPEVFEASNLNRQWGAKLSTVGKSKAFETARMLREISTDTTVVVYPMGIQENVLFSFISGCDIVIDEIELWELEAPIAFHQMARSLRVPILGSNTAGFGAHLFKFTHDGATIEEALGVTITEAQALDTKRRQGTISKAELENLVDRLLLVVTPCLQKYHAREYDTLRNRLLEEGKASIISTNPLFAAGFLGDHIILELLPHLQPEPDNDRIPIMPGYAYIDARSVKAEIVRGRWY
jgi:molybdopterin/thiamine biosynthesis adenylyltransferase